MHRSSRLSVALCAPPRNVEASAAQRKLYFVVAAAPKASHANPKQTSGFPLGRVAERAEWLVPESRT